MNGKKAKMLRKQVRTSMDKYGRKEGFKFYLKKAKKIFNAGLLILFLSFGICYADMLEFPFSCYPKEVQKLFKDNGFKLDLSANDRTKESWGFIESKGSKFYIMTYESLDLKDLEKIKNIMIESRKKES